MATPQTVMAPAVQADPGGTQFAAACPRRVAEMAGGLPWLSRRGLLPHRRAVGQWLGTLYP